MGKMSKRKGNSFELSVAKAMSEWLGFNVRRTPRSGAYGTEGVQSLTGDLMFDFDFPYVVECKHRESWRLEDVFAGKGEVWEWWAKLSEEAKAASKQPMLIIKRNRVEPMVILPGQNSLAYETATSRDSTSYICIGGRTVLWLADVLRQEPPGGRRIDHATEEALPWGPERWPVVGG